MMGSETGKQRHGFLCRIFCLKFMLGNFKTSRFEFVMNPDEFFF